MEGGRRILKDWERLPFPIVFVVDEKWPLCKVFGFAFDPLQYALKSFAWKDRLYK
jgi:hypothetical protein